MPLDSNELALLAGRQGHVAHWLVFLRARNRSTGVIESAGFWTGDDHQAFTIRGEARTYFGAGSLMDVPPISQEVGLQVQHVTVSLAVTPEVEQAIKGYDPSLQPAEIHRAVFDPVTLALIAEPTLIFAGTIDSTPMDDGGIGGVNVITAVIASKVRALTKTLPIYKSDAALRARPCRRISEIRCRGGAMGGPLGHEDRFWQRVRKRAQYHHQPRRDHLECSAFIATSPP